MGSPTVTTTTSAVTPTTAPGRPDTGDVTGFPVATITVGDDALLVAVADNGGRRQKGLRGVADLGDLAGMLFVWERDTTPSFTMRDVPIDLDLALLDADGVVVDTLPMAVCTPTVCPVYGSTTPARYAIESPAGSLGLADGDVVGLP